MRTVAIILMSIIGQLCYSQDTLQIAKYLRIGFTLGCNYSLLHAKDEIKSGDVFNRPGLMIATTGQYQLGKNIFMSTSTELFFSKSYINYVDEVNSSQKFKVYNSGIDLTLHMMQKFGDGKYKPYFTYGPSVKIPFYNKTKTEANDYNKVSFGIDFGVGLECAGKYARIVPELRYSYGLNSFSPISKMSGVRFQNITLMLHFI